LPNTLYYVRAYGNNSAGTGYGNELSFTTNPLGLPELTTDAANSITPTTAVSGGAISADGGASVTARGVCWGSTANPTTSDNKTTDGTGTGAFTSNLTGLEPGTIYHIRAYATNSVGTGYGNDLTFTSASTTASLSTTAISAITTTSATTGGNITSSGGASITARGVCWGTSSGPLVTGLHTTDGSGTGTFTSQLSGLTANTKYYVRAFATNGAGTAYGNEISFTTNAITLATVSTTAATSITGTAAVSGGDVTADGGGTVTARGVCWSVSANPTTSGSKTTDGSGTGTFTSNITGLTQGTLYHIRAYATNSAGTAYGNDLTFTTTATVPTVTTTAISGITQTTATSGGNVTSSGGATVTARGVCWRTSSNPTISDSHTSDGTGTGNFTSSITGLSPNTTYYVRAYATNSSGTSYGSEVNFTSSQLVVPALTTSVPSSVTLNSAVSGGNITSDGGSGVTTRGVCWSTSANPTIGDQHTSNGSGTGSFTSSLTGLTDETLYYVRAYATNGVGTAYGNQIAFSTSLSDVEGNIYKTVVIGDQIWMAENLRTITFNDNTSIPNVQDNSAWIALRTPAYCWYGNSSIYKSTYGALYNWYTVETGILCPTGWHVGSDDEYVTLEQTLGMAADQLYLWGWQGTDEGAQLKSTTGWDPNTGTNTSGFTALPGGYRYGVDGTFNNPNDVTYWWTSTENDTDRGWYRRLDGNNTAVYRASTSKWGGKYVRCVKNN
jgi:uncharacterized protein (TIGR02145 family)